jgi:hypothetical protein
VTVEVVDAKTGEHQTLFTVPNDKDVMAGAISPDERRVYVSYHGRGTGIDGFELTEKGWVSRLYIASHGDFAVVGNVILATTGSGGILEVNDTTRGVERSLNTGLSSHLMDFALDPDRRIIYAAGDCMHVNAGGFTATPWPIAGEAQPPVAPLKSFSVCGGRISVAPGGKWVAVVQTFETLGGPRSGSVQIVDTETGLVLQTLKTESEILDALVIR